MRRVAERGMIRVRRRLRHDMRAMRAGLGEHVRAVPARLRECVRRGLRHDVRGDSRSAVREARSPSSSARVDPGRSSDHEPVPKIWSTCCPIAKSPSAWNVRKQAAPKDDDADRDASGSGMAVRFVRIADLVPGETERRHVIAPTHSPLLERLDG